MKDQSFNEGFDEEAFQGRDGAMGDLVEYGPRKRFVHGGVDERLPGSV
jgi:hypothetical protein